MTTSTTDHSPVTSNSRAVASRDDDRRLARETKPSFKTTELIVYVLSVFNCSALTRAGFWSPC